MPDALNRVRVAAALAVGSLAAAWLCVRTPVEHVDAEMPPSPALSRPREDLSGPFLVELVDTNDAPVPQAEGWLGGCEEPEREIASSISDEAGRLSFASLLPGCYQLKLGAPWRPVSNNSLWRAPGATRTRVRVARSCGGLIQVLDEGRPVAGVRIQATGVPSEQANDQGEVDAPDRACGRLDALVFPPDEPLVQALVNVSAPGERTVIELPRVRSVTVEIVDTMENPVSVRPPAPQMLDWDPVGPGRYVVSARALRADVVVRREDNSAPVAFSLPLDEGVWRVVVDDDAVRVREVKVEVLCEPEACPKRLRTGAGECEGENPFRCSCIGDCTLLAEQEVGSSAWVGVGEVSDPASTAEVDLRRDHRASLAASWGGEAPCTVRLAGPSRIAYPCERGSDIRADGLLPGHWKLLLVSAIGEAASYDLDLAPGQALDLGTVEPQPGEIRGTVVLSTVGPALSLDVDPPASVSVTGDGAVSIRGLSEGTDATLTLVAGGGTFQETMKLKDGFRWEVREDRGEPRKGVHSVEQVAH